MNVICSDNIATLVGVLFSLITTLRSAGDSFLKIGNF